LTAHPAFPDAQWIALHRRGDDRGGLVAIEEGEVPFAIRRVYYIFGTLPGVTRGLHAHHQLNQLIVPVAGQCRMVLDDGTIRGSVMLDDPSRALLLPPMLWHEMTDFSADCVLLVLADAAYDEADYIRDHAEFVAIAAGQ
jgi:dTDP-4-dehydrorhamnose 3,5-epimerase-like enzyme